MKAEHKEIIESIKKLLEKDPTQRFGQVLFNLKINEFKENKNGEDFVLRDIYNDSDIQILERVRKQVEILCGN